MNQPLAPAGERGFLGNTLQVVMVVSDIQQVMRSFTRLGIGPWAIYSLGPHNITQAQYRGKPCTAQLKVALASVGSLTWELIQPLQGDCAQREYLTRRGNGIHHLAVDCNGMEWDARVAEFQNRGYAMIQSGVWLGAVHFGYFQSADADDLVIESLAIPPGFVMPPPEDTYPRAVHS